MTSEIKQRIEQIRRGEVPEEYKKIHGDIKDVIDLRNRVHIRLTNGNELSNADFNRDIYNDAVNLLKTVDEQIYQYAVPLYGCGHTIPISREP